MVQQQAQRWPCSDVRRHFTLKTNMDWMCSVLLNCAFGFTKEVEVVLPLSPSPSPPPLLLLLLLHYLLAVARLGHSRTWRCENQTRRRSPQET